MSGMYSYPHYPRTWKSWTTQTIDSTPKNIGGPVHDMRAYYVKADSSNTARIWIGDGNVNAPDWGFPLEPGEKIRLEGNSACVVMSEFGIQKAYILKEEIGVEW